MSNQWLGNKTMCYNMWSSNNVLGSIHSRCSSCIGCYSWSYSNGSLFAGGDGTRWSSYNSAFNNWGSSYDWSSSSNYWGRVSYWGSNMSYWTRISYWGGNMSYWSNTNYFSNDWSGSDWSLNDGRASWGNYFSGNSIFSNYTSFVSRWNYGAIRASYYSFTSGTLGDWTSTWKNIFLLSPKKKKILYY